MSRWNERLLGLVMKVNRKALIATHWAIKICLTLSIYLVIREPRYLEPYILLGVLVGLQFVIVYFEFLQRSNGPKS